MFFSATVLGFILKPTQKMGTCLSHNLEHVPHYDKNYVKRHSYEIQSNWPEG